MTRETREMLSDLRLKAIAAIIGLALTFALMYGYEQMSPEDQQRIRILMMLQQLQW